MAVKPLKYRIPIDMGLLEILNHKFEQLATDPVVMTNGRVWYNTVEHRAKRIENGVIVPFFSAADALKLSAFETALDDAEQEIIDLNAIILGITSDNILSKYEKPVIRAEYDLLIAEQVGIDIVATQYGITTEKTNYDNAITALTAYLTGLSPSYTDYTQDTAIDGALFRTLFGTVYTTRQLLSNAMSDYAFESLEEALTVANDAKTIADQAAIDAANAMVIVGAVADDGILAIQEKPAIVQQYNVILAEQAGIHAEADEFGVTTELVTYENAVTALTVYLTGLSPAYNDYTANTTIVRVTFNSAFELVYTTRQALLNAIYRAAGELADTARIIANSKKRHFVTEPTTPYEVGDLWSNAVDLYRCITERLVGAFNAADWEVATHYDRTKTVIDGGLVTTGRIEVGGGLLGATNAGMNGSVSGSPTTDIRFWAGATYANRNTAVFRVQDDGTLYATQGYVGGWHIDSDSLHTGTKVTGNGFSAAPGEMTIKSDGSIHAYNIYINADGTVSFKSTGSQMSTTPRDGGDLDGAVSTVTPNSPVVPDIIEIELVSGSSGSVEFSINSVAHSASWDTSLELTASNFVDVYGGLGVGYANITVTHDGAKLIFTRTNGFIGTIYITDNGIITGGSSHSSIYDAGVKQKDKVTLSGTGGMCTLNCNNATGIVFYNHSIITGVALTNTAADFVYNNATEFLSHGVVLTSVANEIFLEASVGGTAFSPATASSNIPTGTLGGITLIGNEIMEVAENSNSGAILINLRGYNGGTAKTRDVYIGDGRGNTIMKIDGAFSYITVTIPDNASPGTFHTGHLYYDGGTLKIT